MPDAKRPDLDNLDWSPERRSDSLSRIFGHAIGLAAAQECWYAKARRRNRRWAQALRVASILLGGVAAVIPILAEIYTTGGKPVIPAGWAAIAIAAAVTLVGLDRFFGFSAAWMRFMAAELRIARLRHDFEYAWESARAATSIPPADDVVIDAVRLAHEFVVGIDDAVAEETSAWIVEFRSTLTTTEQKLKHTP